MDKKKLSLKERKAWVLGGVALVAAISIGFGFYYFNNNKTVRTIEDLGDFELSKKVIQFGESLGDYPIIFVNGTDVARMTEGERRSYIDSEVEGFRAQTFTATYNDRELNTTLGNLGVKLEDDINTILSDLEDVQNETKKEQLAMRSRVPFIGKYELTYTYTEENVEEWVETIANQVNVSMINPVLNRPGNVTAGRTGISVVTDKLSKDLHEELSDFSKSSFNVEVDVEYIEPTISQSALESVNAKVSAASSTFPTSDAERTHNVKLAAQKVNGTVLMPGEEFSFGAAVEPVTFAGGYKGATIFIDGQTSEGVGGGICQISSTMYWAQLRAGILPTQRRNHSLPVGYVPLGLDATYATGGIDYRFANTLDYPVYISAYTSGNTLHIEFWSNSSALNGLSYEPRVSQTDKNSQSQTWATFLRTYNSSGSLVSEQFLHNSTYRQPSN